MEPKISPLFRQVDIKIILIHITIGVAVGYFFLHPITMVIYWFEISNSRVTFNGILEAFNERFVHTFSMHMMPMSVAFAIIGGLIGLASGLYFQKIRNQHRKIQSQRHHLTESIQSIIRNGENDKVEFKASFRYDFRKGQPNKTLEEVVMKSIAGFMNAGGGILIIGVDEMGHLKGLADDFVSLGKQNRKGFEQRLMQVMAERLGTDLCPLVHVAFHQITDREIFSASIEKAHRPVYIREGDNPVFYLRTGNTTKPMNTMETVEYLKQRINDK
jgi:hypothetical protein